MSYKEQAVHLAGPIGLLKYYATRVLHDIADDAVQIMGGRGISQGGMGKFIEIFQRTYKVSFSSTDCTCTDCVIQFDAILGGSEEILNLLGVKQAMKQMPLAVL